MSLISCVTKGKCPWNTSSAEWSVMALSRKSICAIALQAELAVSSYMILGADMQDTLWLGMELPGHSICAHSTSWQSIKLFSKVAGLNFMFLQGMCTRSCDSIFPLTLGICQTSTFFCPNGYEMISHYDLYLCFPDYYWGRMYSLAIYFACHC